MRLGTCGEMPRVASSLTRRVQYSWSPSRQYDTPAPRVLVPMAGAGGSDNYLVELRAVLVALRAEAAGGRI
eukprot:325580-Prymnesium_polylepis.1